MRSFASLRTTGGWIAVVIATAIRVFAPPSSSLLPEVAIALALLAAVGLVGRGLAGGAATKRPVRRHQPLPDPEAAERTVHAGDVPADRERIETAALAGRSRRRLAGLDDVSRRPDAAGAGHEAVPAGAI